MATKKGLPSSPIVQSLEAVQQSLTARGEREAASTVQEAIDGLLANQNSRQNIELEDDQTVKF